MATLKNKYGFGPYADRLRDNYTFSNDEQRDHYGDAGYWDAYFGRNTPTNPIPPSTPTPTPTPTPAKTPEQIRQELLNSVRQEAEDRALILADRRGLDQEQFNPLIDQELDYMFSTLGDTADPRSLLNDNKLNAIFDTEQNRLRTQYNQQANEQFSPTYSQGLIGDNVLDSVINDILSEQQSGAMDFLERGKARGIYNDVGYNEGINQISNMEDVGAARLNELEQGVLGKYRTQADQVRDKAYGAASGFTLGNDFSFDPYFEQGNNIKSQFEQFGGGELKSALGGTNFFDFGSLTNAAGQAQGAQNLRDADVATALAERKRVSSQGRGLGSQGVF